MSRLVHSLRSLYELRKSTPLDQRRSVGRVFFLNQFFGLIDPSGILWPIEVGEQLSSQAPRIEGAQIDFLSSFYRPDGLSATKYKDNGYLLKIEKVLEIVPSLEDYLLPNTVTQEFSATLNPREAGTFFFKNNLNPLFSKLGQRDIAHRRTQQFFRNRGFLQVFPPLLVPSGGVEEHMQVFKTSYMDFKKRPWPLELCTSPEFSIKKSLIDGHKKIFSVTPSFRNGGEFSAWHQPEFTMVEWYRVGGDLDQLMSDVCHLVKSIADSVGSLIDVSLDWPVYAVPELFQELVRLNLDDLQDRDDFWLAARPHSPSLEEHDDWQTIFSKVYLDKLEPFLTAQQCCFVNDFPIQFAALAKGKALGPFAHRVEGYLRGVEICNGFLELCDPDEIKTRFLRVLDRRGKELSWDENFYAAMRNGMPPSAGMALGFDRTLAILLGCHSISEVQLLPFENLFWSDSPEKR